MRMMRFIFINLVMICMFCTVIGGAVDVVQIAKTVGTTVEDMVKTPTRPNTPTNDPLESINQNLLKSLTAVTSTSGGQIVTPAPIQNINQLMTYWQTQNELTNEIMIQDLLKNKFPRSEIPIATAMAQKLIDTNLEDLETSRNTLLDSYDSAFKKNDLATLSAIDNIGKVLYSIDPDSDFQSELDHKFLDDSAAISESQFKNLPLQVQKYIIDKATSLANNMGPEYNAKINQFKNAYNEYLRDQAGVRVLAAAQFGSFLADKFGLERFTFMDQFWESEFGRFMMGEPSFGICETKVRSSGNTLGIIMDNTLEGRILAHVEGEKSKLTYPDGKVEYFYRITLQVNGKPVKEGETQPDVKYNVDLYTNGAAAGSVFKEDQKSKGSASLTGTSALVKYSNKDYTTLCLRSSSGNTCNSFVDVSQLARVEGTAIVPGGYSGISGGQSTNADPYNEW